MDYKKMMGYGDKKKTNKKESKPKTNKILEEVKKELNEWSHQPPTEKRWSGASDKGLTEFEKQGGKDNLNEVDFSKVKLPSTVDRFLNKFVDSMKSANLNRLKRSAVLYKVIDASGMNPQQLMADIQKIKKEL